MTRYLWIIAPVGLAAVSLIANVLLALAAHGDPSFSVEQDYYQRAVDWDDELERRRISAELGWRAEAAAAGHETLTVELTDPDGAPLSGAELEAEVFHQARANDRTRARMLEVSPGRYAATLPLERSGWWEARLSVRRGEQRFWATEKVWVGAP